MFLIQRAILSIDVGPLEASMPFDSTARSRAVARALLCASLLISAATSAGAQRGSDVPPPPRARIGTILVAHGGSKEWNDHVRAILAQARIDGPAEVSFLMGPEARTARFHEAVERLVAQGVEQITVVPMMVSSHSEHYQQIRYLAGATDSLDHSLHAHMGHGGLERARATVPITVTPALDDAHELATALADRAGAAGRAPAEHALFLVGHGPNTAEDYAHWMEHLRRVAERVRELTGFRDVRVDLVRDDAPPHVRREAVRRVRELIGMQQALTGREVVVIPVLISKGRISRETFLADLAGLPVVYPGEPLLPHPALARWIERRARDASPGAASAPPAFPR